MGNGNSVGYPPSTGTVNSFGGSALLVRPDQHVAFRHAKAAPNATALLWDAMARILGFKTAGAGAADHGGKS